MMDGPRKIPINPKNAGPGKTFYQVLLKYNGAVPEVADSVPEDSRIMESHPITSASEANKVLAGVAREVQAKLETSEIVTLSPKEQLDDFSVLVLRKRKSADEDIVILARLGIVKTDYSGETIH